MNYMPVVDRAPTARERAYLEALATGVRRPSISGQAGNMCRKFGWCEAIYQLPDATEALRSHLPLGMDSIAIVKAGYRLLGYALTERGRKALGQA
jgi:hypothetical protein